MKDRNLVHSDDWATPKDFYDKLDAEFGFDFDPCPLSCDTEKFDGLVADWGGGELRQSSVLPRAQGSVRQEMNRGISKREDLRIPHPGIHFHETLP